MSKDNKNLHAFKSTEEELNLYKRLVAELPVEIDYFDEIMNLRVRKAKHDSSIWMEKFCETDSNPRKLATPFLNKNFFAARSFSTTHA